VARVPSLLYSPYWSSPLPSPVALLPASPASTRGGATAGGGLHVVITDHVCLCGTRHHRPSSRCSHATSSSPSALPYAPTRLASTSTLTARRLPDSDGVRPARPVALDSDDVVPVLSSSLRMPRRHLPLAPPLPAPAPPTTSHARLRPLQTPHPYSNVCVVILGSAPLLPDLLRSRRRLPA
jgi:hypothetical protein